MNQYTLSNTVRTVLIAFMAIGLVSLGITWFVDDELHSRFWSNLLHNSVFFTGISFMAIFFIAVCITAYAGWYVLFKRVWESFSMFLIPGFILMAIMAISVYFHANHLYHWGDTSLVDPANPNYDEILDSKDGFLNRNWYLFGTIIIVGLWVFFANKLRSLSIQEDNEGSKGDYSFHRSMRKYAAIFLPIAGFSSAAMVWQWVMSVDAHWYSTMFAWYASSSWFVSMIALTILVLLYLKGKDYFPHVSHEHMHDLGKFLFAFSIFWTYLWFSQFMLIWYGNVGEETIYFKHRMDNYPILHYGNLVINFLIPFFVLMRNDTKRKFGTLGLVAGIVLFGHWLDFFLMLKPGILHTTHEVLGVSHHGGGHGAEDAHGATGHMDAGHGVADHVADAAHHVAEATGHAAEHASHFVSGFSLPGLLEIGTFLGFLGLFLFVALSALTKAKLTPEHDPYLEESLHHHV